MATAAIPSASPEPARRGPAFLIVAALLCAVVIVDPVREFRSQDDGWAYARSVEHLLRTGEYRLDAWSAANNPVQIYLAAGLAEIFGHSLGLLRLSTLMLLVASLAALYGLLRRGSLPAWPAAVLTLGLLASPLVMMLSFTFMSDIQFMGWMLIALWLYSRGFESRSEGNLLLGSIAAACAIGTRQFGVALIVGVVVAWLVSRPASRPALRSLLRALTLPLAVSAWQLRAGLATPNFPQVVRLHEQAYFPGTAVRHGSRLRHFRWRAPW
jgi:4-amino-4-deoxy-L-arabinose transferase-like glycosyltransferase